MNDLNQRIYMENQYKGEEVPNSFKETVSYIVLYFFTLIRTWIILIINFQIVESESFFGFCNFEAKNHWIAIVSDF